MCSAPSADRLKMIWWDGTGLVMAYKRLEQNVFKWPAIKDGVLRLDAAQFEALVPGLDWRRVIALETRPPAAAQ
jgi:transposase